MTEKTRVEIYVDDQQAIDQMKKLADAVDQATQKVEQMRRANDRIGLKEANAELKEANQQYKNYKNTVADVSKVLNNLSGTSLNNLLKAQRQLRGELGAMNKNTAEEIALYKAKVKALQQVGSQITTVRSEMGGFSAATSKVNLGLSSLKSLLPALGLTAVVMGIKNFMVSSAKAADEAIVSEKRLLVALGMRRDIYERLNKLAGELMLKYNIPDEAIRDAQVYLANQERTESQIRKTVQAAILLSNVTGDDLLTATQKLGATYEGSIGRLGRLDSGFKDLTKTQLENGAAVDLVLSKYADFTNKDVGLGKVKAMTVAWNEFKESMGKGEFPLINWVTKQLSTAIEGMSLMLKYGTWWKFGHDASANYLKESYKDLQHIAEISKEVTRQMDIADQVTKQTGETATEHYKNRLAQMLAQNELYKETHSLEIEALQRLIEMVTGSEKAKKDEIQSIKILKDRLSELKTAREDINVADSQALIINMKQIEALDALIKKYEDLGKTMENQKQPGVTKMESIDSGSFDDIMSQFDELQNTYPTYIEQRTEAETNFNEWLLNADAETAQGRLNILDEMHRQKMISDDEYSAGVAALNDDTNAKILASAQNTAMAIGMITQGMVNFNTAQMNKELKAAGNNEAKKEAIKKEYAKKNQELAVIQARIAGAMAIMNIWAGSITGNPLVDTILKALLTIAQIVMTESQVSEIKSATYAQGNYADIIGAMDGKRYRAKVADSKHPSGLFSEPTYVPGFGLFGETKQPELVFNPVDTQKMINSPGLINAINATIGNGRQYANGNTREIIRENRSEMFTDPVMLSAINRLNDNIERGIQAKLIANEDYIDTHKKVINDHDTFLSKVNAG